MVAQTFVLVIGPPAVGKLSVARVLAQHTGFGLTHNHVAIEAALLLFKFGTPDFRSLVRKIRHEIYHAAAVSSLPGMIGTFVWDFGSPNSRQIVEEWCEIFHQAGWRIVFVELKAGLETRLQRNRAPGRAIGKASKQDPTVSEDILLTNERDWTMVAPIDYPMRPLADHWLSIVTDDMEATTVSKWIVENASLSSRSS